MAKRILLILAITTALFPTAALAETYGAILTGAQEVPPVNSSGFGNATVTLDPAHTSFRVQMAVTGLSSNILDAHIHGPNGPAGVNDGVLVGLSPGVNLVNGRMDQTFPISKENGDAIAANPQNFYFNVHTSNFPGGEVRGQLTALDSLVVLAAELRGTNEVPANNTAATGSALITLDQNNVVTWDLNATGLANPTRGHIHEQVAGVNGGIVVNFTDDPAAFSPGSRLRGSGTIADAALANRLRTNPAGFYVNVHSTEFPGGEIRGQLTAANEYDVAVAGKVTGANGENFVSNVRIFNPSFSARSTA
ncbi:MAG TPA: CHRD domain-containing protein, partial [Thermoanaerobaculia bacterium]|nr:CHRD domain-containing protein [Thermoanaerobaculia bacterium]